MVLHGAELREGAWQEVVANLFENFSRGGLDRALAWLDQSARQKEQVQFFGASRSCGAVAG